MKKFLQKTLCRLQALLLLAVLFVAGSSAAWADTETFNLPTDENKADFIFSGGMNWYGAYWVGDALVIEAPEGITMTKIVITDNSGWRVGAELTSNPGSFTAQSTGSHTWEGDASTVTIYPGYNSWAPGTVVITYQEDVIADPVYYTVAVSGTSDANAGVVYNGKTYHDGETITAKKELTVDAVSPAEVEGLEGVVSLSDHEFTVTYSQPAYFDITTNASSVTKNGVTAKGSIFNGYLNLYAQGSWTVTVTSANFDIEKIELFGDTPFPCTVNVGNYDNASVWTCNDGNYREVVFTPTSGDKLVKSIRIWPKGGAVEETPRENTVDLTTEGVAMSPAAGTVDYLSRNITLYLNTNCEKNHYAWDGGNACPTGVTLKDAGGNSMTISEFNYWANSNQVGIVLANPVYTPGVYTLTIPEGTVPCVDNKGNKAFEFVFTVAPSFPEEGKLYVIKNVESERYINIKSDASYCAYLAETSEPLSFTLDVANGGFIVKDADNYYLGGHATSTWNMNSSVAEYWTLEPLEENGQYAFKSKTSNYMGFNDPLGSNWNAFRDKTKVPAAHYAFTIEEYVAPTTYTVTFVNAPAGASATIDGNVYTESTTFTVSKVLDENSVTAVADVEGYTHEYAYADQTFTITYTALLAYEYVVSIFPTDDTDLKIRIDGKEYGDSGMDTYTFYKELTEADIVAPDYSGYYPTPSIEIDNSNYVITVEYTPLPTLAVTANGTDAEGNCWTSFCFNAPVSFPESVTPCIVTGTEEDGTLAVKEFPIADGTLTTKYDFENNAVEEIMGNLYCDGDNHDVTMSCSGVSVYQSIGGKGYLKDEGTLNISCLTTPITKVIVKPWGWGTGANISLNGADPVAVADGDDSYTFDVNSYSCTLDITNYNGGVYLLWIEVVTSSGKTVPVFPAGTGLLVKSAAPNDKVPYTVHTDGEVNADTTGNLLVGCTSNATWNETGKTYYKFSLDAENTAGSAGFYWGVDGGASIEAHAGKAYLVLDTPVASNSRYLISGFGDTITGIDTVLSSEAAEAIYNLQGQRVLNAKSGVYVKNGKKVIVK